jgi:hypothetical protein
MTSTADRTAFRNVVAQVAEKAKARLPQAVNGRIESAVKLVLVQDVTPQADGSILVGSSTDPLKVYRLVGTSCECVDFTRGQAPGGWCQHRIAAGIARRVQELLPPDPTPVVQVPVEPWPDNDPEELQTGEEPTAPPRTTRDTSPAPGTPTGLPEARCSLNVHMVIDGVPVQMTLRGHEEREVLARLKAVLEQYPQPQPPAQAATQGRPVLVLAQDGPGLVQGEVMARGAAALPTAKERTYEEQRRAGSLGCACHPPLPRLRPARDGHLLSSDALRPLAFAPRHRL